MRSRSTACEDGHYQFKYLPLFAVIMAPFGLIELEIGKALWFAISIGLLVLVMRWSVSALPDRRLPRATLVVFAVVLMAKFLAHELLLGQVNLLLGAMLLAALVSVQMKRPNAAGALVGSCRVRQTLRADPVAVAARHSGLASCRHRGRDRDCRLVRCRHSSTGGPATSICFAPGSTR